LRFKIGYDVPADQVKRMFEAAFDSAVADEDISIESQNPLEIRLQDAGDHAIEWSVHYYTKDEFSIIKTRQLFRQKILESSIDANIGLSTPITHQSV